MPGVEEYNNTKVDRELFAVFREEKGLSAGDPYVEANPLPERWKGKQLGVPFQPKGSGPDAMIDKTTKLTIPGDKYIDQYKIQQFMEKRGSGKAVTEKPFKPTNPAGKSIGAGSLYGIFGPPSQLLDLDPSIANRRASSDPADHKKGIYTTVPKQGGFGFPIQDRTIGGTKYDYIPDTYAYGRVIEKDLKKEARAKFGKPFVSTGRTGRGITAIPPVSSGPDTVPHKQPNTLDGKKGWKSGGPIPKGRGDYGCINKLVYVPCPTKAPPKQAHGKVFKPGGNLHERLSMWAPNPYEFEARPPPDNDMSLLG